MANNAFDERYRTANDKARLTQPTTVFGERLTAEISPLVQESAVYGLETERMETFTATGGSVGASGGFWQCQTGTSVGGYGVIRSKASVIYHPGQEVDIRFTGKFTVVGGMANSLQGVGAFTATDAILFGYDGTKYSILHQHHGALETQTLQITGAAGGSENATVTIGGDAYTVPLTSGTVQHNAYEVWDYLNTNGTGYTFFQNNDSVICRSASAAVEEGAFSFSSGTATGTFTQNVVGAAKQNNYIPGDKWDIVKVGGTNLPTIDPTKINVYQFKYGYLGAASIMCYILDPATNHFILVHTIKWANEQSTPSFGNPSLKLGVIAASLGSTVNLTTECASLMGGVAGPSIGGSRTHGHDVKVAGVSNSSQGLLGIRNRPVYNGKNNQGEIKPYLLTVSTDGTKGAVIRISKNATIAGERNYQYHDEDNSIAEYDESTGAATVSGAGVITAFTVPSSAGITINLKELGIRLYPGEELSITGESLAGGSPSDQIDIGITWAEDV